MIRKATLHDIPQIMTVLEANLLSNQSHKNKTELENQGFLLFGFTTDELKEYIQDEKKYLLLVAEEENQIVGYALGYDESHADQKIFYHRHIAVLPDKKGVGKSLMQTVIENARCHHYQNITCNIAHSPMRNLPSIAFHQKQGFQLLHSKKMDDGFEFGIYQLVL